MKAIVLKGPRQLEMLEIPKPKLTEATHVLIQVRSCGICGSDVRYYMGENPWALHTLGKSVANPPNIVLGHEFSGIVHEVNSSAYEHLLGQRVGVQAFRTCGTCRLCTSGHENLCRNTVHIGHAQGWGEMAYFPGGYAEYSLGWADLLHSMAHDVSFEQEAMRDILGVAVHAVGRAELFSGCTVLCIGGGPAGLCTAQVARARGAERVFVSDPSPLARQVLRQYQGLTTIDPRETPLASVVYEATGGQGCDAILDSVGTDETFEEALGLLAETGHYVNLAVHDISLPFNAKQVGAERTITSSSNAYYRDEREAHKLIESGQVEVGRMITHRFPLSEYQQAFDLLLREPKEAYKVVFQLDRRPRPLKEGRAGV